MDKEDKGVVFACVFCIAGKQNRQNEQKQCVTCLWKHF